MIQPPAIDKGGVSPSPMQKCDITRPEKIKLWLEIWAIVLGSIWAIYTFGYEKWWVPNHVPAQITATILLSQGRTATDTNNQRYIPLTVTLEAVNNSDRTLDMLETILIISGTKVTLVHYQQNEWVHDVKESIGSDHEELAQLYFKPVTSKIVATASPFRGEDNSLSPKEKIVRSYEVYVPEGLYDQIQAVATIPSANKNSKLSIKWDLNKDNQLELTAFRKERSGNFTELKQNATGTDGLQIASTRIQLNLNR